MVNRKGRGALLLALAFSLFASADASAQDSGEPTLVGTLNTTRPGRLFAVVITVRRAGR